MPVTERFEDQRIDIRISSRLLERLRRAAKAAGEPVARFVKRATLNEITRMEQSGRLDNRGDIQ